jgi:SAM-dependent methyltransferase
MFASVVPGMTALVTEQLQRLPGVRVTDAGFDGRADLILFEAGPGSRSALWSLRTIEDLFVEVGRTLRASGDKPHWTAQRVWRPQRVERALAAWSRENRGPARPVTYRVIARVLQERSFLRSDLRRALTTAIGKDKPAWKVTDPARLEVWISEYQPGRLVAGLRLSARRMRQHDGREVERPGALRPTVAAMMVSLAGEPGGTLLDPCCGAGTILAEATATGWPEVLGGDIDPGAVRAAQRNAPGAVVTPADARRTGLPGESVTAVVSNLPFGQQYEVEGDMAAWLTTVLAELARVTRPGGRVILLTPALPRSVIPPSLRVAARHQIRLLGTRTTLWRCERL